MCDQDLFVEEAEMNHVTILSLSNTIIIIIKVQKK